MHPDDETLALLALGEEVEPGARDHVAGCSRCQAEVASFGDVVGTVRASREDAGLQSPAPHVWDRVAAELGLDPGTSPDEGTSTRASSDAPAGTSAQAAAPVTALAADGADRGRRRGAWALAATFFLGAAGAVAADRLLFPDEATGRVVATADLQPLPGWDDVGSASLEEVDGARVLTVQLPSGSAAGFREVWLIDTELERLVSLGVLAGPEGRFAIPGDLDLAEFAIVDVSDEPYDGDPAHSGDSIVRGQLS